MPARKKSDDGGAAEVQEAFDEAAAKGYFGVVPDENPNSAYSLESGPDSPPAVEDSTTRAPLPEPPKES